MHRRSATVGVLVASSSIVFVEPAPYDILALIIAAIYLLSGRGFPRGIALPFVFLVLFLTGNVLATALSDHPEIGIKAIAIRHYLVLTWLLFVGLVAREPSSMIATIWTAYCFAAVIAAIWGIFEYLGFIPWEQWPAGQRAKGPFKDPNVLGPFLVPVVTYAAYRLMTFRRRKLLFAGIFAITMTGVFLTFSRGAWLNALIALASLVIMMLVTRQSQRAAFVRAAIAGLGVIVVAVTVGFAGQSELVAVRLEDRAVFVKDYDVAEGGRFATQYRVLTTALETPIGLGAGASQRTFGRTPHNVFLHAVIEGGWIAAVGLAGFVLVSLYKGSRSLQLHEHREQLVVVIASLLGLIAESFFIDSTHWRHLYLMFGLLWGVVLSAQPVDVVRTAAGNRAWRRELHQLG